MTCRRIWKSQGWEATSLKVRTIFKDSSIGCGQVAARCLVDCQLQEQR